MRVNAMSEKFEYIELFGKPVLFTNSRIDRATVPKNWYCYDIRGSDSDLGRLSTLESKVVINHAGTVLSPSEIPFSRGKDYRSIRGKHNFLGETLTIAQFCETHSLAFPENTPKYNLRPASSDEAGLFYALTPEDDLEQGIFGHLRIDFGHRGKEFWSTWHPRGDNALNNDEFKHEFDELVNSLPENGPLKDLRAMEQYCHENGGEIKGGWQQNYGFVAESDSYRYYMRFCPYQGDYNCYLTCMDKRVQEMNQSMETEQNMTIGGM